MKKLILKRQTNSKSPNKVTAIVISQKGMESALLIDQLLLEPKDIDNSKLGFDNIKDFKDVKLWHKTFAIRLNTLGSIIDWLNAESRKITNE